MTRDPESIVLEAEYWHHVIADLLELNDLLARAAEPVPAIAVGLVEALIGADAQTAGRVAAVSELVGEVQPPIMQAQGVLMNLLALAHGRVKALRVEGGIDEAPDA